MVAGPFGRKRSLKQKLDWKTKSSNVARWAAGESSIISCQLCANHLPALKWNGLLYSSLSYLIALCTATSVLPLYIILPQLWETPLVSCDTQQAQQFNITQNPLPCLPPPQNHFFQRDDAQHVDIKLTMLVNSKELEDRSVYLYLTITTESLILIHVKMQFERTFFHGDNSEAAL